MNIADPIHETKLILNDLHDEFEQEKLELKNKLEHNSSQIELIDESIHELMQYDDDSQMFSPRNLAGSNQEKIKKLTENKDSLLEENQYISSRLKYYENKVDSLALAIQDVEEDSKAVNKELDLERLNKVFDDTTPSNESEMQETENNHSDDSSAENDDLIFKKSDDLVISAVDIKNLIYKLNVSLKFIDHDPMRSRVEINSVIQRLNKFIVS